VEVTPNLELPYILPSQAQKHVTHNEAIRTLDALVQLAVADRHRTSPPPAPAEGDRHIVAAGAAGAWAGSDGAVAAWQDGAWHLIEPRTGWIAWVGEEQRAVVRASDTWMPLEAAIGSLQNLEALGVGTESDVENPFAARLNKALWTALETDDGGTGDLRYTLNKQAAGNVLSILMQSGFAGRAEIGLVGDDDLIVKTSADGGDWIEALRVSRVDGSVVPASLRHAASGLPMSSFLPFAAPTGTNELYRMDVSSEAAPRSATIDAVAGDTITLSASVATRFFGNGMAGHSLLRIWNTTKTPWQAAWVRARPSNASLQVHDAADIATWVSGDVIQVGDHGNPALGGVLPGMIALDISPALQSAYGQVFPQAGIVLAANIVSGGTAGDTLGYSPTGLSGTVTALTKTMVAGVQSGNANALVSCTEPSPVSQSNLVMIQETFAGTVGTRLVRCSGLFV
jgi:hypothetical protein